MITEAKINEYIRCYKTSGRPHIKIINDQEWHFIDQMVSKIGLIRRGLASKDFEENHQDDLSKFDSPKTYKILQEYEQEEPLVVINYRTKALQRHRLLRYTGWGVAYLPLWHFIFFNVWDSFGNSLVVESFLACLMISFFIGLPIWMLSVRPTQWSLMRKCLTPLLYLLLYFVQFIPHLVLLSVAFASFSAG
jgi:hypothetical protein